MIEKENLEKMQEKGTNIKYKKKESLLLEGIKLGYDCKLKYLKCGLFVYADLNTNTITFINENEFEALL